MNRKLFFIIILVFYSISFAQDRNSRKSRYGFEVNFRPTIYYNTFISYKEGIKLIISLNIQNDVLQFKKYENTYNAKYEISINLKDFSETQSLFTESWNESAQIEDFEETNSKRRYQNSNKSFNINQKPGKYKLLIEVRDAQTGNNFYSKRNIEIKDQTNAEIKFSNLVLVNNENQDINEKISVFNDIIEINTSPTLLMEYATQEIDSLTIESKIYKIENNKNKLIYNKIHKVLSTNQYNNFFEKIDNSSLEEGTYFIKYQLSQSENKTSVLDTFKVAWYEKPTYLYKYDLALRPMKYLMSPEEYEDVEDLSNDELEKWFKKYWKERDDTPETTFNEVQFEFYSRVQKSINNYSLRFKEGWRTERGQTLILYGEPTNIDKHHHVAKAKPFEVWYYENLNKKITFLDKKNNGDFKLVSIENIEEQ